MTDALFHWPEKGYFTLEQCIYSPLAHENEINNYPGSDYLSSSYGSNDPNLFRDSIILNIHKTFKYCVNPIFKKFNDQIGLTSAYRNKELNQLLGGVKNSQHIYGYAADIVPISVGLPTSEIFNWCIKNLPSYHQIIWEYPERGSYIEGESSYPELMARGGSPSFSWIHISYIEGNNYRENSVSSLNPNVHKFYENENTYSIGNFTHKIEEANEQLIKNL